MTTANGDPAAALTVTKKAVDTFRGGFFTPQGFYLWWRYTQALTANKKSKEASQAIEQAYDLLLERVANVRDEGLRRNFLNKVEDNRKLLQFWVQDATKRSKGGSRSVPTKERIYAHLAVETNIREPFKRLADTGLRLNTLHTAPEIQNFLVEEATELIGGERVMLILEKDVNNVMSWDTSQMNTNIALIRNGVLAVYLAGNLGVYKCPADSYLSPAQRARGFMGRTRSLAMNAFFGPYSANPSAGETWVQGRNWPFQ